MFLFKCNLFQGRKPGTNYLWFLPHLPIPSLDISTLFRFFLFRRTARKRKREKGGGEEEEEEEESVTPPRLSKFALFLNIHGPQQFSNDIFRSLEDLSFLPRFSMYIHDRDEILFSHKFLFLDIHSTILSLSILPSYSPPHCSNSQSTILYPLFFSINKHHSKHRLIYVFIYIYVMPRINVSNISSEFIRSFFMKGLS